MNLSQRGAEQKRCAIWATARSFPPTGGNSDGLIEASACVEADGLFEVLIQPQMGTDSYLVF